MSVRAAASVGQARVRGATLHSSDLTFEPGAVTGGAFNFAIGTAGATGLVLHTIYLPLALRSSTSCAITISGGTHVKTSPCYHFLESTWLAYLRHCGLEVELQMVRPGFYPRGGGVLNARVRPCAGLRGFVLEDVGRPTRITGLSAVAGLRRDIAERQARHARHSLRRCGLEVTIEEEEWPGGPGSMLALALDTAPAPTLVFSLGERGKPAERVADQAVHQLLDYLTVKPARVDAHSADQIVLPLALADGPSRYSVAEVTQHLVTNVAVIRQFLDRTIEVEGALGRPGAVIVQ
jgi:RNA 3'-terminal phosphate cyclase (ATP)